MMYTKDEWEQIKEALADFPEVLEGKSFLTIDEYFRMKKEAEE